jgi:starch phosphorylase
MDQELEKHWKKNNDKGLVERKKEMKRQLFKVVANQTGKFFDENILTVVWARRFAGYKRADLLMQDFERFRKLMSNTQYPIQIIWAGKPYPQDHGALEMFNQIYYRSKEFANCAVLVGYEMELSALLKRGSDVWLNTPRIYREASGTSGMTAAMNGSINLSIADGWIPEFAKDGKNCFIVPSAKDNLDTESKDRIETANLYAILEKIIVPMYYQKQKSWIKILKQGMKDVVPFFGSNRMADEYYSKMYNS